MNTAMLRSDAMKPGWYSIKLIDFRRTGRIHFDEHEDDEVEWGSGNELADRTCSVLEKLQVSFDGRLKKCRQFQEWLCSYEKFQTGFQIEWIRWRRFGSAIVLCWAACPMVGESHALRSRPQPEPSTASTIGVHLSLWHFFCKCDCTYWGFLKWRSAKQSQTIGFNAKIMIYSILTWMIAHRTCSRVWSSVHRGSCIWACRNRQFSGTDPMLRMSNWNIA